SEEKLKSLEDIGPKVAGSVAHFFSNASNIEMLKELEQLGLTLKNEKRDHDTSGNLSGKTFLITGTLPTLKRSEAEAIAEDNDATILSGVSAKLNYQIGRASC